MRKKCYDECYRLERECTKDCIIAGMEFKKGDLIGIPVYAVHHCSDYYHDPETFDPDRFGFPFLIRSGRIVKFFS